MKITICGTPGSGKSTLARMLAAHYKLTHYDIGTLFRQEAKKRGMPLEEFGEWAKTHPAQSDKLVDDIQIAIGKNEDNFIIEGRLSYYFIPDSIKIFVDVDIVEGAKRVFSDYKKNPSRNEKTYKNSAEVEVAIKERVARDLKRYGDLYGIKLYEPTAFDILMNSTGLSADDVFKKVITIIEQIK